MQSRLSLLPFPGEALARTWHQIGAWILLMRRASAAFVALSRVLVPLMIATSRLMGPPMASAEARAHSTVLDQTEHVGLPSWLHCRHVL